jgi:archaellum component FlaC
MTSKKDEFLEQLKKKVDDLNYRWSIERNKLEAQAQHESAAAIQKFKEKREDLRRLRESMTSRIRDVESAGDHAWGDMKEGAEEAWKALTDAFDKAKSHFRK